MVCVQHGYKKCEVSELQLNCVRRDSGTCNEIPYIDQLVKKYTAYSSYFCDFRFGCQTIRDF